MMIQTVKKYLRRAVGQTTLTNTLLTKIESTVNSPPLTYVYDDVEGLSYSISPSHLNYEFT